MTRCSYIFLDEAGNLDFSANGTRYFVLTSISMRRPFPVYEALNDYKHDCLEYGLDMEYFHCAADNNHVRKGVFDLIAAHLGGMRHMSIDSLVVEKRKTGPALREDMRFYPEMLGHLLKFGELYIRVDGFGLVGQHGLGNLPGIRAPVIGFEWFLLHGLLGIFVIGHLLSPMAGYQAIREEQRERLGLALLY